MRALISKKILQVQLTQMVRHDDDAVYRHILRCLDARDTLAHADVIIKKLFNAEECPANNAQAQKQLALVRDQYFAYVGPMHMQYILDNSRTNNRAVKLHAAKAVNYHRQQTKQAVYACLSIKSKILYLLQHPLYSCSS